MCSSNNGDDMNIHEIITNLMDAFSSLTGGNDIGNLVATSLTFVALADGGNLTDKLARLRMQALSTNDERRRQDK